MTLHAYTDGASRGNPGESGIGMVVRGEDGTLLFSGSGYIGIATNNVAEYAALLALLKKMAKMKCDSLTVHSDSELMVRQINGEYKIKNEEISKYRQRITKILNKNGFEFTIKHIPREMNSEADRLANQGIESRRPLRWRSP
jgi:ribonuclease HI